MAVSHFKDHPNFDPDLDATVAAWVYATTQKRWDDMTEAEQATAYMDFMIIIDDDEIPPAWLN